MDDHVSGTPGHDRLTAYLLGRLSPEEEQHVEQEYLASEERFLELRAAEDELVDDFAAGRLLPDDRQRFEQRLLRHPEMGERVAFARALARTAAAESPVRPATRWLPWLAAAGLVVSVGVAGLAEWRVRETRRALAATTARAEALQAEVWRQGERIRELARVPATAAATWTLVAGRTRDGATGPGSFAVPAGTWVRLRLPLEQDAYPTYSATLRTGDGEALLTVPVARLDGGALEAMVPVSRLRPGAFDLVLMGADGGAAWEDVDVYPIRITPRQHTPPR
jgi:hypothetical protein